MTEEEREFWEWIGITPLEKEKTKSFERNEEKAINWDLERIHYNLNQGLK
jgi:hypothetical protein